MMLSDKTNHTEEDVNNLISDITHMKTSLVEYVIRQHRTFDTDNFSLQDLSDKFEVTHARAKLVIDESEKACNVLFLSLEDRDKYKRQINSLNLLRITAVDLLELDKLFRNLHNLANFGFDLSVTSLNTLSREIILIQTVVERASSTLRSQDNRVFQALIGNITETKILLIDKLKGVWDAKVIIERNGRNIYYNYANPSQNEVQIPFCKSLSFDLDTDVMREIICLMHNLEFGHKYMLQLMTFISEELLYPIIENFQHFCLSSSSGNNKISIALYSRSPDNLQILFDRANLFLDSLTKTFDLIYTEILSIAHDDSKIKTNYLIKEVQKTLFGDKLIEVLTKYFMPELFEIRQEITERMYTFNDMLIGYGFIDRNNTSLREYIKNFDHFAEGFVESHHLTTCRRFYLYPILDYNSKDRSTFVYNENIRSDHFFKENPILSKFIDLKTVIFPDCNVSVMVTEMVSIMMDSISHYHDKSQEDLLETINFIRMFPDIMSMYLSVVPISSKKELEDIPKAAALHYNNCLFLAHHCMTVSPSIKSLVSDITERLIITDIKHLIACQNVPISLLKVAYIMRKAAADTLFNECNKQKEQLNEFFADIDTFVGIGTREQRIIIEKIVKKCHMHLFLLSEAYSVLPARIFDSFFGGSLVNHALTLVIGKVMKMTDIVQNDNREIVSLVTDLCNKLLDIIIKHDLAISGNDQSTVTTAYMIENIPCWQKLQMLLFVLKKSLIEIEDFYADGKSPLADQLSGNELKSLIKALFKNSHLRSKVLEKIN